MTEIGAVVGCPHGVQESSDKSPAPFNKDIHREVLALLDDWSTHTDVHERLRASRSRWTRWTVWWTFPLGTLTVLELRGLLESKSVDGPYPRRRVFQRKVRQG